MNTEAETDTPLVDSAGLRLLQEHRKGAVLNDLAAALRTVTEAVQLAGKSGSVQVKFTIEPATKIANAVVITDDVKATLPKVKQGGSFFFTDAEGNLHREDPKQMPLNLRTVEGGAKVQDPKALKEVNA